MKVKLRIIISFFAVSLWAQSAACWGQEEAVAVSNSYQVQAGDVLQISVWREPDLQLEVVVRPDGGFSMPLVGNLEAQGKTVQQMGEEIKQRLVKFMPDVSVNVAVKQVMGNKIYVIGSVNRPGEYVINRDVDVMQALSMAAGMTKFADLDGIKILRRVNQQPEVLRFNYKQVMKGRHLEQNVVLRSGDVVVVP